MSKLLGTVALVTGGSRGIGAAIATRLAADGAAVTLTYVSDSGSADSVVAAIEASGGQASALRSDVRDPDSAAQVIDSVMETHGRLDVLVNNAGIARDGLLVRMSDQDFDDVIQTNLTGVFRMCRAAARPMMKARAGSIINLTSVIGLVGNAGQVNYAAAKAGVIGLTKSVARELASRSIRCNAVAPGFIETDMTADLGDAVREAALSGIALKRFGEADDVAAAVSFLASSDSTYITGQVIAVDGGMTFT